MQQQKLNTAFNKLLKEFWHFSSVSPVFKEHLPAASFFAVSCNLHDPQPLLRTIIKQASLYAISAHQPV